MKRWYFLILFLAIASTSSAQSAKEVTGVFVDSGWANNSVNTIIFRKNSLYTYKSIQYIAYYNRDGFVVLGKRNLGSATRTLQATKFTGDVTGAHRSVSIIADGDGLFIQYTDQKDGEGKAKILPYPNNVLEIKIK
jgi:BNR repeat-containing family member